jgi:phosphatidylglycerophosphatase A
LAAATHYSSAAWIVGLVLFRVFDITKPRPVRQLEALKPAGAGIVMDDVMAGVYGAAVMALLGWFKLY